MATDNQTSASSSNNKDDLSDPQILSSLDATHMLMKERKPFTFAEKVIKDFLLVIVGTMLGESEELESMKKVPLSENTMVRNCTLIAQDLKEQLLLKLHESPCFGLLIHVSVDEYGETYLLVFCRLPDASTNQISDYLLFCYYVGVDSTATSILTKLEEIFSAEKLQWEKCVAVNTSGRAKKHKEFSAFIEKKNPECKFNPKIFSNDSNENKWIVNPFAVQDVCDAKLNKENTNKLLELKNDRVKNGQFLKSPFSEFWVRTLQDTGYKSLATVAVSKLVAMPKTPLAKRAYWALADIRKKNEMNGEDELMRGFLEKLILPRNEKIAGQIKGSSSSSAN